jgi:hypothetical protein
MDPQTTSTPVVVNMSDGEVRLKKLSPSHFIELANKLAAGRKAALRQNCKDAGVPPDVMLAKLNEFDARPVRSGDVLSWVNTPEGQFQTILASLRIDKPDAGNPDVDKLGLDPTNMIGVAAALLNVEVQRGQASPLPEGGGTSQTGTGDVTQAGSAAT